MNSKIFNKKTILASLLFAITIFITACSGSDSEKITVGGKNYTEQDIMVHLVSELIESETDLEVERKPFLGGTNVVFNALEAGDVDLSVEYTGTAYASILDESGLKDKDEIYERVKSEYSDQFGIEWLEPLGFNNTYALAMKEDEAEELGIEKVSDLEEYAKDFDLASDQEFLERDDDGLEPMLETYGLEFNDEIGMDAGLLYGAIDEGEVDVIVAFATDGRVPEFDLRILEDDQNFFPPYDAAVNAREETLEEHPELKDLLNELAGEFTDEEMAKLNAKVDIDGKDSEKAAEEWLIDQGLID